MKVHCITNTKPEENLEPNAKTSKLDTALLSQAEKETNGKHSVRHDIELARNQQKHVKYKKILLLKINKSKTGTTREQETSPYCDRSTQYSKKKELKFQEESQSRMSKNSSTIGVQCEPQNNGMRKIIKITKPNTITSVSEINSKKPICSNLHSMQNLRCNKWSGNSMSGELALIKNRTHEEIGEAVTIALKDTRGNDCTIELQGISDDEDTEHETILPKNSMKDTRNSSNMLSNKILTVNRNSFCSVKDICSSSSNDDP